MIRRTDDHFNRFARGRMVRPGNLATPCGKRDMISESVCAEPENDYSEGTAETRQATLWRGKPPGIARRPVCPARTRRYVASIVPGHSTSNSATPSRSTCPSTPTPPSPSWSRETAAGGGSPRIDGAFECHHDRHAAPGTLLVVYLVRRLTD